MWQSYGIVTASGSKEERVGISESYQVALVRTARGGPVTSGAAYLISFPGTEQGGAGRRDVE